MPQFRYKAFSTDGELLEGEIQARSHEAVIEWIKASGHTPIRAEEIGVGRLSLAQLKFRRRGRRPDVGRLTRDLATLLKAGVPLDRALEMLIELAEEREASDLLGQVLDEVRGGASLAEAMEGQQGVFSRFYVNMIRAGEAGGALEGVLTRLATYIEQYNELKSGVRTALIYPAILIVVTLASLVVLMVLVVPQFAGLFEDLGQELPLPTRIVIGAGEAFQAYWWVLIAVVVGAVAYLRGQLRNPQFRYRWDRWLLGRRLVGDLIAKIQVSIFARMLATLLSSGVPLLGALSIVKETLTNRVLANVVESVAESVREGLGLADRLAASGAFPRLAAHLVRVGEESGQLESTLFQLADIYDREVRASIQRLLSFLGPVLIIGLGVMVGGIIASILVAIMSINELAF